jgi:hypothetical protein
MSLEFELQLEGLAVHSSYEPVYEQLLLSAVPKEKMSDLDLVRVYKRLDEVEDVRFHLPNGGKETYRLGDYIGQANMMAQLDRFKRKVGLLYFVQVVLRDNQ